jgi:hypothetical protein
LLASQDPPPGAVGYSETPNGRHWYRRTKTAEGKRRVAPWKYQDEGFVIASKNRGNLWHERLFNDDGSRRSAPVAMPTANMKDKGTY